MDYKYHSPRSFTKKLPAFHFYLSCNSLKDQIQRTYSLIIIFIIHCIDLHEHSSINTWLVACISFPSSCNLPKIKYKEPIHIIINLHHTLHWSSWTFKHQYVISEFPHHWLQTTSTNNFRSRSKLKKFLTIKIYMQQVFNKDDVFDYPTIWTHFQK